MQGRIVVVRGHVPAAREGRLPSWCWCIVVVAGISPPHYWGRLLGFDLDLDLDFDLDRILILTLRVKNYIRSARGVGGIGPEPSGGGSG